MLRAALSKLHVLKGRGRGSGGGSKMGMGECGGVRNRSGNSTLNSQASLSFIHVGSILYGIPKGRNQFKKEIVIQAGRLCGLVVRVSG
jgi:hypothetical protein